MSRFVPNKRVGAACIAATVTALVAGAGAGPALAQDFMSESEFAELVAAAQAEGSLMIYAGTSEPVLAQMAENFSDEYGIDVLFFRATGNVLTQRFLAEQSANALQADVFGTSEGPFFEEHASSFLPLKSSRLPALEAWPDEAYTDAKIQVTTSTLGAHYNTSRVSEAELPRTWDDFLDPAWQDRLILTDPQGSANYTAWAHAMAEYKGLDYLETLAERGLLVVASGSTGAQQIAAGARDAGLPTVPSFSQGLKAQGAPIDFVVPSDPTLFYSYHYAVVADSPNPNAAKLFFNWLVSEGGISLLCAEGLRTSFVDPDGEWGCDVLPDGPLVPLDYGYTSEESGPVFDALGLR